MLLNTCNTCMFLIYLRYCFCNEGGANFFSNQKYEEKAFGELSVTNDIWGWNPGYQEINAKSGSDWCVKCSHPNSDNVKSYPHSKRVLNKTVCSYKVITSSFAGYSSVNTGCWSFSYDIWLQKRKYEIMLWMWISGKIQPIGSLNQPNVKLGNFVWNVWKGSNGQNEVFSFVNQHPCWNGTVNIKAMLDWIILKQKWISEGQNVIIDEIQHGFELTSTPTDAKFCMTEFCVKVY